MKPVKIIVSGDIVLDHHIYEDERLHLRDDNVPGLSITVEPGGAALTQRLVSAVFQRQQEEAAAAWQLKAEQARKEGKSVPKEPEAPVRGVALAFDLSGSHGGICPFPDHLKSYAEWKPAPGKGKDSVWRVGRGLGFGRLSETKSPATGESFPRANTKLRAVPDILVLDDAGAGFRQPSQQQHWHLPAPSKRGGGKLSVPRWIVLKLGSSVGAGDLWLRLQAIGARERLVIVVSVDVLRLMEVQLNPGLSWEQSAGQLMAELASNPSLRPLQQCGIWWLPSAMMAQSGWIWRNRKLRRRS